MRSVVPAHLPASCPQAVPLAIPRYLESPGLPRPTQAVQQASAASSTRMMQVASSRMALVECTRVGVFRRHAFETATRAAKPPLSKTG